MEKITDFSQLKKGDLCSFSVEFDGIEINYVDVFIEGDEQYGVLLFKSRAYDLDNFLAIYRLEHADNRIIVGDVWVDMNNVEIEVVGSDVSKISILTGGGEIDFWSRENFENYYHKKSNAPTEVEKAIKVLEDAGRIKNGKIIE